MGLLVGNNSVARLVSLCDPGTKAATAGRRFIEADFENRCLAGCVKLVNFDDLAA
jgi:hypothetical protein